MRYQGSIAALLLVAAILALIWAIRRRKAGLERPHLRIDPSAAGATLVAAGLIVALGIAVWVAAGLR